MILTTTSPPQTSGQFKVTAFISDKSFPCAGAKSALNRNRMRFAKFATLGAQPHALQLLDNLKEFFGEFENPGADPESFVAMFDDSGADEAGFDAAPWRELQALHILDAAQGGAWDSSVSSDVSYNKFSFSAGGRAYFIVGVLLNASRLSRRSPVTCLVSNFHDQFEALKTSRKFVQMQSSKRTRFVDLQGFVNPVLARYGKATEARQYSGRSVGDALKCPVHFETAAYV